MASAPRALWKGYLKLDRLSCAIKIVGAWTEVEKIKFRTINRQTGNTVRSTYVDEGTGETVDREHQVKGLELENDEYLLVEPAEVEKLKKASDHRLEIGGFVASADVSPLYLEQPYYVIPADEMATETYLVIREAMEREDVVALGTVVMQSREQAIMLSPHGKGLMMTKLRPPQEVVDEKAIFKGIDSPKPDKEVAELLDLIIQRKPIKFDPSKFEDRYEQGLIALIEAKKKGKKLPVKKAPKPKQNVVNLAALLKKSLAQEGGGKSAAKGKRKAA